VAWNKFDCVCAHVHRLKPIGDFVHTITFDNGKEFAAHQDIAHALKAKIFFATPSLHFNHLKFKINGRCGLGTAAYPPR
jgi:IS30 family transposase